jgi:Lipocalin-like domain
MCCGWNRKEQTLLSVQTASWKKRKTGEPKMPSYLLLIASSLIMLVGPALAESQNWLVGTWRVVSATQIENGQNRDYFGPHPLGQVKFDADGRFSNILLRSDLKRFRSNNRTTGTAEENAEVVKGSIAYFGTYTLAGENLKMHIEASSFPNWTGTDQSRVVHPSGDQFTWENAAGSGGGRIKLVFEKVK